MTTEKQKTGGNATRKDYAALEREVVELRALNAELLADANRKDYAALEREVKELRALNMEWLKDSDERYEKLKELNARLRALWS